MRNKILLAATVSLTLLAACTDNTSKSHVNSGSTTTDTSFNRTDSMELIYYANPEKQKEYNSAHSHNAQLIHAIAADLSSAAIQAKACVHYKKLYLFDSGEVFKTIYVSDSCNYLAYSVNGTQQFRRLSETTKSALDAEFKRLKLSEEH